MEKQSPYASRRVRVVNAGLLVKDLGKRDFATLAPATASPKHFRELVQG